MFTDISRVSGALKTEKDDSHHKSYYVREKSGTPHLAFHFLVTTKAIVKRCQCHHQQLGEIPEKNGGCNSHGFK